MYIFLIASCGHWPLTRFAFLTFWNYTCRLLICHKSSSRHHQLPTLLRCTRSHFPKHLISIPKSESTALIFYLRND